MDFDAKITLMQMILAMESYLITEIEQKKITGISKMTDKALKQYYILLQSHFADCL
jgi:hypothetical protein